MLRWHLSIPETGYEGGRVRDMTGRGVREWQAPVRPVPAIPAQHRQGARGGSIGSAVPRRDPRDTGNEIIEGLVKRNAADPPIVIRPAPGRLPHANPAKRTQAKIERPNNEEFIGRR